MKNNKIFIIAEAGVNHNGSIKIAKQLIDYAVDAGADCVKFQTFKAKNLVTVNASKAEYQIRNQSSSESQYEMLKKLELNIDDHKVLIDYAEKQGILWSISLGENRSIGWRVTADILSSNASYIRLEYPQTNIFIYCNSFQVDTLSTISISR